jgi:general secretion pathway protein K
VNGGRTRRGFALLTVLAVIVALGAIQMQFLVDGSEAVDGTRNRSALTRAQWRAEGLLWRVIALADNGPREHARTPAARLNLAVEGVGPVRGCVVEARALGSTVNPNAAEPALIRSVLRNSGVTAAVADSLADALLDWIDGDEIPRPAGAEREWYEQNRRMAPRNAPLGATSELLSIRGFSAHPRAAALFGIESVPISLTHAPAAILAALPGFTPEAVARLIEQRSAGADWIDLAALSHAISEPARSQLMASRDDLLRLVSPHSNSWDIVATCSDDRVTSTVVIRVILGERFVEPISIMAGP